MQTKKVMDQVRRSRVHVPALFCENTLPERAVGGTSGHCAEQVWVDFDHLLDRLRGCGKLINGVTSLICQTDVSTGCRSRIDADNHSVLELEAKRGCAVGKLDAAVARLPWIGHLIHARVLFQEINGLMLCEGMCRGN